MVPTFSFKIFQFFQARKCVKVTKYVEVNTLVDMHWMIWNVAAVIPNMFSDNGPWLKVSLLQ